MQLDLLPKESESVAPDTAVRKKVHRPPPPDTNSSSGDDGTLATRRGNAALGSVSDTDSKANRYEPVAPPSAADAKVEQAEPADAKTPGAFRTISETARFLDLPQHVLRFWESRFTQIKPLKLHGGRRYYRPEDIDVLATIKHLLYKQGYTIKGAKKAFRAARFAVPPVSTPETAAAPQDNRLRKMAILRQELLRLQALLAPYVVK